MEMVIQQQQQQQAATDPDDSSTISPLPGAYYHGQLAIAAVGMLSLVSTSLLWLHITYRLVQWKRRASRWDSRRHAEATAPQGIDLSVGLSQSHYRQAKGAALMSTAARVDSTAAGRGARPRPPNPLLILIYNLIFADVLLSASSISSVVWLRRDAIEVGSPACAAQGWLMNFGCLTTSAFLATIAAYTYAITVRGHKPSSWFVQVNVACIWALSVVASCLGPLVTRGHGGFYGRHTLWCYISVTHWKWRLPAYVWGFVAVTTTIGLYILTFSALYREKRSSRFMPSTPPPASSSSTVSVLAHETSSSSSNNNNNTSETNLPLRPSGHHPAFLIYPFLYIFGASPVVIGSMVGSLERNPAFMAFTGSMLAATGLLDAILWSTTVVLSRPEDLVNAGLDQFAFIRTPEDRSFGNMVWVQGGADGGGGGGGGGQQGGRGGGSVRRARSRSRSRPGRGGERWWREDSLGPLSPPGCGGGIRMDVVTSVVVRDEGEGRFTTRKGREGSVWSASLKDECG